MAIIPLMLVFFAILCLIVGLAMWGIKKGTSGIKLMLFGINLTLFGGIIAIDPNSNLGGIEYLIIISGLIVSAIGLGKKD